MLTFSYDDMRREIMNHLKVRPTGYGTWKVSTYVLDGAGNRINDWFITHNEEDYRGAEGEDPQEWRERMAERFLDSWDEEGCPDGIEYDGGDEYLVGVEEDEDLEESRRPSRRGRVLKERFQKDGWCAPSATELAKSMKDGVDWLVENGSGCCHWPIYRDEERGNIWSIVMGWSEYDGGDENVYFEDGYTIRVGIRYQSERNAMQSDYDYDFTIPETDDGDAYDISYSVEKNEDFRKLARNMLAEGKSVVKEWV